MYFVIDLVLEIMFACSTCTNGGSLYTKAQVVLVVVIKYISNGGCVHVL